MNGTLDAQDVGLSTALENINDTHPLSMYVEVFIFNTLISTLRLTSIR